MRNLKRALSLALASVMLLGMMMIGTSAAGIDDFNDSDTIQNQEAVTLTAGLGIFQGRTNGDFDPTAPVSRAEMAVIICKILHGADVAPSNFTGVKNFSDVPAWAEGYVNMCSSLGIIAGRGNGIFDPDATVTTVEASTMLLRALGYYRGEDALGADWKLTVTSRATQAGVVGDMVLDVDAPLTRDNVAQMTYNTLFAQMVAYDNGRTLYVKNTDRNTVVTASTEDDANTLAYHTFHLWTVEGIVVANGYTTKGFMETSRSAARTQIMFTEPTDLDKDGRNELKENEAYDFEYDTDLDLIGHNVKVYYQKDGRDYKVYTMFDKATLVAYINWTDKTTKLADRANDAGFQKDTILNFGETSKNADYIVNYDWDVRFKELTNAAAGNFDSGRKLDQLLVISNSANKQVDVVIALDQYLNTVKSVEEIRGETDYTLTDEQGTENVTWKWDSAPEADDYVICTNIGEQNEIVVFQPADVRTGDLSRIDGTSNANADDGKLTFEGTAYGQSNVDDNTAKIVDLTPFKRVSDIGEVTLIFDDHNKIIAQVKKTIPNYVYVAQFGYRHTTSGLNTAEDELTALVYKADGTSKIYIVDTNNAGTRAVLNYRVASLVLQNSDDNDRTNNLKYLNGDPAIDAQYSDGAFGGKGIYKVEYKANDTKIQFVNDAENTIDVVTTGDLVDGTVNAETKLLKGHSTFIKGQRANAVTPDSYTMMNDTDTLFFYVTGSYRDFENGAAKNSLGVRVVQSIKEVDNVTNYIGRDDTLVDNLVRGAAIGKTGLRQGLGVKSTAGRLNTDRMVMGAVLITGVGYTSAEVYYFNQQYSAIRVEGGYGVEYTLYESKTGDAYTVTYNDTDGSPFSTSEAARNHAKGILPGFYTIGANSLKAHLIATTTPAGSPAFNQGLGANGDTTYYVVKDTAEYDEFVDNLFTSQADYGAIAENAKVVDVCNSGLTSVTRIIRELKNFSNLANIELSFSYDKNYNSNVIFVVKYDPDAATAPGTVSGSRYFGSTYSPTATGSTLTFSGVQVYSSSDDTNPITDSPAASDLKVRYTVTMHNFFTGDERTYVVPSGTATMASGLFSDSITLLGGTTGFTWYDVTAEISWKDATNRPVKIVETWTDLFP